MMYYREVLHHAKKTFTQLKAKEVLMYFPDLRLFPEALKRLQEDYDIKKDYFGYYKFIVKAVHYELG